MSSYTITKDDIKSRVYFITKLVQNQTGSTMQGALTSKSDSMGGIFDRFINTLSDSLIFDKIIFQNSAFTNLGKTIKAIEDFYYYSPTQSSAGIAPDLIGIKVDGQSVPFAKFNERWEAVQNTPQIEVKTYKAKDQMISLRNQHYDEEYLILADLDLRIDYLVPFLDQNCLSNKCLDSMRMDDEKFILSDEHNQLSKISAIDYSSEEIGTLKLIAITSASDFMKQSTLCDGNISVFRMKEINERKVLVRSGALNDRLDSFAHTSPRVSSLYEFNANWYEKMGISANTKCLDFSSDRIDSIRICKYNAKGIVIYSDEEGCSFNGLKLVPRHQYSVSFEILDRSGNGGSEYFMQKICASHLNSLETKLTQDFMSVINNLHIY